MSRLVSVIPIILCFVGIKKLSSTSSARRISMPAVVVWHPVSATANTVFLRVFFLLLCPIFFKDSGDKRTSTAIKGGGCGRLFMKVPLSLSHSICGSVNETCFEDATFESRDSRPSENPVTLPRNRR